MARWQDDDAGDFWLVVLDGRDDRVRVRPDVAAEIEPLLTAMPPRPWTVVRFVDWAGARCLFRLDQIVGLMEATRAQRDEEDRLIEACNQEGG